MEFTYNLLCALVQLLSRVQLFATPWTSRSITNSQSLLKLLSIKSVMPSTISSSVIPFSYCLQSFPVSGSFQMSQFFASGGQSIGVSASTSVLPMNTQDWSPLGWTGWISLQSKGLSRVFSNTTVQKHQFINTLLSSQSDSHPYMTTGKTIALARRTFVGKVMSLLFNMLSRLVITFHPRSSVQSLSCVRLFATPWIKAHQASLSITNSWSSPKLMSIKSVMPSHRALMLVGP